MDTIGRIGFRVNKITYKLCAIKVSKSDGSIYIGFSFGTLHANRGLAGQKITYHPDGNTWLTVDLQKKLVGEAFIVKASTAHIIGLKVSQEGHIYVKGENYGLQPSFDEIEDEKLIVKLKNRAEFFNIHHKRDYASLYAVEGNSSKLSVTDTLSGEDFFGIRADFFLISHSRTMEFESAVRKKGATVIYRYSHPSRDITVFTIIRNTTKTPGRTESL